MWTMSKSWCWRSSSSYSWSSMVLSSGSMMSINICVCILTSYIHVSRVMIWTSDDMYLHLYICHVFSFAEWNCIRTHIYLSPYHACTYLWLYRIYACIPISMSISNIRFTVFVSCIHVSIYTYIVYKCIYISISYCMYLYLYHIYTNLCICISDIIVTRICIYVIHTRIYIYIMYSPSHNEVVYWHAPISISSICVSISTSYIHACISIPYIYASISIFYIRVSIPISYVGVSISISYICVSLYVFSLAEWSCMINMTLIETFSSQEKCVRERIRMCLLSPKH